jgi:hypothetical protein
LDEKRKTTQRFLQIPAGHQTNQKVKGAMRGTLQTRLVLDSAFPWSDIELAAGITDRVVEL